MDILKLLANTPIPTILVAAGLFFLFLAIGGQFGAKIVTDKVKQQYAAALGGICLLLGLAIYWMGSNHITSPQVPEPGEPTGPAAIQHTSEPEPARVKEELAAQIHEVRVAFKQNDMEQEKTRAEIERLQSFLKSDPDASKAMERQEEHVRELGSEYQKLVKELQRLERLQQKSQ